MIAVDKDRASVRSVESLSESVLTVVGVYGPNASGKSNVIEALAWLSIPSNSSDKVGRTNTEVFDEIPDYIGFTSSFELKIGLAVKSRHE
jgi:hypothetical protein